MGEETLVLIHAKAHVDTSVKIGEGTKVYQFASVIRGAVIGSDCSLGSCSIVDGALVGDRCKIQHGAQLHPGTKIGNDVFIGPNAVLCNDMWPSTSKEGFDAALLRSGSRWVAVVDDGGAVGAGAMIFPGIRVHKGALVAAGARPDRDVQSGMVWRVNGYMTAIPADANERRMLFVNEGISLAADAA